MPGSLRFHRTTLFALAAALVFSFGFAGCSAKKEKKIRIGFLVKSPEEKGFRTNGGSPRNARTRTGSNW